MLAKGLSARSACKLAGLSRAVATYALKQPERDAAQLKALRQAARKNPRYGYRRVAIKSGLGFGQTWRLWKQHDFRLAEQRRRRKKEPAGSCERPHRAEFPGHVWTYDILYDQLADGRVFKTLSVLDEFTRECHGILVATSIRAVGVTRYLARLMRRHGAPQFLRSDNGSEFTAQVVQAWLEPHHTGSAFIPPGQPWQNGFIESFHDKFRDECLEREWFQSLTEAQVMIEKWRKQYNTQRPHSSLGYQTPAEFAAGCQHQSAESLTSRGHKK